MLVILCLLRADGRPTLPGESIVESGLTLWGVEATWLRSSAEPILVPWWTEQLDRLDNSLLPQFLLEKKVPVEVLMIAD